jgi:hypothetical protein
MLARGKLHGHLSECIVQQSYFVGTSGFRQDIFQVTGLDLMGGITQVSDGADNMKGE